jgi:hypothetical protein
MRVVTKSMASACFSPIGPMTSANSALAKDASKEPAMADAPTQLGQDRQYQAFLYAPVDEDQHGISGTVLSMLVRFGVDPWCEASDFANLPEGAAQQGCETLMAQGQ